MISLLSEMNRTSSKLAAQALESKSMAWLKHNWLGALVVIGIVFSLLVVRHDASAQADKDRREASEATRQTKIDARHGCERSGVQKALAAAGWLRAAEARRADGNEGAARYYEGIADGMILTIPAPAPDMLGMRVLAEVKKQHIAGRDRYVLTPRAQRVQRAGCEKAYPLS